MLQIKNISVRYQASEDYALHNVTFSIKEGEVVIIAGNSGSGKSTLAQTILGLIPQFIPATVQGEILFDNKSINELNRVDFMKTFGYVPQYPSDYTISLLVEEEIAFPLENLQYGSQEIHTRIREVLAEIDLEELRHRLVTELSSGELQRISLAVALATNPSIFVFDEPMARMDPTSQIELVKTMERLKTDGYMILIFEHHLEYLLPLANRVVLLENGKIKSTGKPRDMLHELRHVNIPEISKLKIPNVDTPPISLSEAEKQFMAWFKQKKADG